MRPFHAGVSVASAMFGKRADHRPDGDAGLGASEHGAEAMVDPAPERHMVR